MIQVIMFKTNQTKETMVTLTEKETKLVQHLIDINDGSDAHSFDWIDLEKINMNQNEAKGVFGSIIDKDILEYSEFHTDIRKDNGGEDIEIYTFTIPVDGEQQEHRLDSDVLYEIKTTQDYLNLVNKEKTK
mgnify:FL=1